MQTVLYVSPMTTGDEVEVRRILDTFPVAILDTNIGVERMVSFIGSGLLAFEFTVGDGNFQEEFGRFLGTQEVQTLFQQLAPYASNLPSSEQQTADMPLMAAAMLWQSASDRAATS